MDKFYYTAEEVQDALDEIECAYTFERKVDADYETILDDFDAFIANSGDDIDDKHFAKLPIRKALCAALKSIEEGKSLDNYGVDFGGLNEHIDYDILDIFKED